MSEQGYVTIATGKEFYYQLCVNFAISVKINDPKRPVCLICDDEAKIPEAARALFDDVVVIDEDPDYSGCANKLRIFDFSPYAENMYVDSDCLIVKPDMDRHWSILSAYDFNLAGGKRTSGGWYSFEIADICRDLDIPYMVHMNSGVFYYKKNDGGRRIFDTANELFATQRDRLGMIHRNVGNQYADEPFFGAAMGVNGVEPIGYNSEDGSIMITTLYARNCAFDVRKGESRIDKPTGFYLLNRFLAKGWVKHSPSVAHFIKLKPVKLYQNLSDTIRADYSIPSYNFRA